MIQIKTSFPIAEDSLDHIYPEGVYLDNNVSINFVNQVENYWQNTKRNFLDLGCAGGALAVAMHERGHKSVGIDGSDKMINIDPEVDKHFGFLPYGYENWKIHHNKILFTADVTKEFNVVEDGNTIKFDLITCWDVMEHFEPDSIDLFLEQVEKHLSDDGIFIGSIAIFSSGSRLPWTDVSNPKNDIDYHRSIFEKSWWIDKFKSSFEICSYPFTICNREYIGLDEERYYVFCIKKRK